MYINTRSNTILLAWLNDFILGSMRNVKNVMKCICAAYIDSRKKHFKPPHDKPNKMTFVPIEDSDQPQADSADSDQTGRMPRLI